MFDQIPEIIVLSDYEGYFERLVRSWIQKKIIQTPLNGLQFNHARVTISAGPYRPYAVEFHEQNNDTLHLDFYSALRSGFGSIEPSEITEIVRML